MTPFRYHIASIFAIAAFILLTLRFDMLIRRLRHYAAIDADMLPPFDYFITPFRHYAAITPFRHIRCRHCRFTADVSRCCQLPL